MLRAELGRCQFEAAGAELTAFGARPSLLGLLAKVASFREERSLSLGSGAVASCP